MTPDASSARTRRRHADGLSRTRSASSAFVRRPSAWSWPMIARSVRSTAEDSNWMVSGAVFRHHLSREAPYSAAMDVHPRSAVMRDALGIGVAVGAFGLSYGAIATASGFSVLQTCALSVLMFTGASQFALVGVVGAGGSAIAGAMTALLLGSR